MSDLSVAVVIPVLNEDKSLLQHINTFKALDNKYHVVFCDSGSIDKTCSVLQQHKLHYCTSAKGRAIQMNTGAVLSKSDIILFMHADTVMTASGIEAVKKVMLDDSVVGGHFDIRLSGEGFVFRVIEWMINLRSRMTGISTGDQCQFVRRSVFEAMGGFPKQALMEDVEFSKRLKRYGKLVSLRDKVVTSSRRWEQYGVVKTIALMWKMRLLYWLGISPETLAQMYRNVR